MRNCRKFEDLIARFLHGELLLTEREDLESHVAVCPDCERAYTEAVEIDRALRELPDKLVDPPPFLATRILARVEEEARATAPRWGFGRIAAACSALAAASLAAVLLYRGIPGPVSRVDSRVPEPVAPAAPAPVPAARPSPAVPPATAAARRVEVIREVKIFFYYPAARKVAVTGDFNGWDPDGVPLKRTGRPGLWVTELRIPPGAYSYNFIVDGDILVPDPNAPNQMPDGYGGTNSILLVKGDAA